MRIWVPPTSSLQLATAYNGLELLSGTLREALSASTTYPYNLVVGVTLIGTAIYLAKRYFGGGVCYSKAKLNGKAAIITGANTGVGLETAVDLSCRGARVILACRSVERGKAAEKEVKRRSKSNDVVFVQLDLASLKSVREFAAKILESEPHIDILVNNAGVMIPPYSKTEDDFELQFGVNHLAHFLLTKLLLDRMKEAPSARIVNVSSLAHGSGKIDYDDLQFDNKPYSNGWPAYCQSKLANVLFTRSLAKRIRGTNVTAYSLHPGAVKTELSRHVNPIFGIILAPVVWLTFKTPWQGAQTSIYCAVTEGIEGQSGEYFSDCKVKKVTNPNATDDVAERLWRVSADLVGLESEE